MATRDIKTRLSVEGESKYKAAITGINSELGRLNSALKLSKSEFQNHQNSMEALKSKTEALTAIQEAQQKKVSTIKDAYQNAQSALQTYSQKADATRTALDRNNEALSKLDASTVKSGEEWLKYSDKAKAAEEKLKELQKSSSDTSEEEAKLQKQITDLNKKMEDLDKATDGAASTAADLLAENRDLTVELSRNEAGQKSVTKAVNDWGKQLNNAQIQLNNTNSDLELTSKYLKEAENSADGCATSIDEFGKSTKQAGNDGEKSMQDMANTIVSLGIASKVKDIALAFYDCAEAAGEFEYQMSTVKAISGATAEEMADLTDLAKTLGATTSFTAKQAGEAMEYFSMAGFTAEETASAVADALNLAAAGGTDLGTTADIVSDALTAFGLSASDTSRFVDVLAQTSSKSNTNVNMMGETFKYAGAICGSLGISIEDAATATGLMANAGIKASQAGTALRAGLSRLAAPTDTVKAAMKEFGVELQKNDDGSVNLMRTMELLRDSIGELEGAELNAATKALFGQQAMTGWDAIIAASDEDFADLADAITNSTGAAERMAAIKLDNFEGQLTLLSSAADGLTVAIGEDLTPALGIGVEMLTNMLGAFTEFIENNPGVTAALVGITAGLGALAAGCTAVLVATNLLIPAFTSLSAVLAANPVGAAIMGFTALASAIVAATAVMATQDSKAKELKKGYKDLKESIDETSKSYKDFKAENESSVKINERMAQTLENLVGKAEKSTAEYTQMMGIITQLNNTVPGLNLEYDEQTNSLSRTNSEIEKYIELAGQSTQHDSDVERLNELYAEQASIEEQLKTAQDAVTQAQADQAVVLEKYTEDYAYCNSEYTTAIENLNAANEAVSNLTEMQAQNEEEINSLSDSLGAYSGVMESAKENTDGAIDSSMTMTAAIEDLEKEYNESYASAQSSIEGQFALWDQAAEVVEMDSKKIRKAIKSQINYWTDYADNLDSVTSRNIDGLDLMVASIDDGSAEAAGYIAAMSEMSDEELEKLVGSWNKLQEKEDEVAQKHAELETNYSEVMDGINATVENGVGNLDKSDLAEQNALNTMAGFDKGIGSGAATSVYQMQLAMNGINTAAQTALGEHSPSTIYERFGRNTLAGFNIGVRNEKSGSTSLMSSVATGIINAFTGKVKPSELNGVGSGLISGFTTGANSQQNSATSTMTTIAGNAVTGFKKKTGRNELHSSGADLISGFQSGANAKRTSVSSTMGSIASNASSSFRSHTGSLYSSGSDTIQGYINGVSSRSGSLYSTLSNLASNAISAFKRKLNINSPSKVFNEFGINTVEGYEGGIDMRAENMKTKMRDLGSKATRSFAEGMKDKLDIPSTVSDFDAAFKIDVNGKANNDDVISLLEKIAAAQDNNGAERILREVKDTNESLFESFVKALDNIEVKVGRRDFGRVARHAT